MTQGKEHSERPLLPTNLMKEEALQLVSSYLSKEWKFLKPEDVSVVRLQTGYNNQVYVVSNDKTVKEPRKVIIRKYGGNSVGNKETLRPLTTTEELVLVCELSNRNLAPKLYGFFEGGRIEEFIDSHQITEEEACTPEIETNLAKNLARFHAVDNLPFPRPGYQFAVVLKEHYRGAAASIEKVVNDKTLSDIHPVVQYDWESELEWLSPLLSEDKHGMVLMHWDTHLQNIGVRNTRTENDGGLRTILYDYELSSYNMRGKDIGLFLVSKIGLLGSTDMKLPKEKIDFPAEEDCRLFINEYRKECSKLFEDWDADPKNSLNHIMMESIIGSMVSAVCFFFACINNHEHFVSANPDFFKGILVRLNDCYFSGKKRLHTAYPNYEELL